MVNSILGVSRNSIYDSNAHIIWDCEYNVYFYKLRGDRYKKLLRSVK